jgi:hypothetical protein
VANSKNTKKGFLQEQKSKTPIDILQKMRGTTLQQPSLLTLEHAVEQHNKLPLILERPRFTLKPSALSVYLTLLPSKQ